MIFLIAYDRKQQKLLQLTSYAVDERDVAWIARAIAEREYNEDVEVVLVEAASEDTLRVTHAAYFYTFSELLQRLKKDLQE